MRKNIVDKWTGDFDGIFWVAQILTILAIAPIRIYGQIGHVIQHVQKSHTKENNKYPMACVPFYLY